MIQVPTAPSFHPTAPAFAPPRRTRRRLTALALGALISGLFGVSLAHGLRLTPADSRLSPPAPKLIVAAEPDAPDQEWRTYADLAGS